MEGNTVSFVCEAASARWWAFTWNNYTESDTQTLEEWCRANCQKFGFTKEIAPTTGTPHLQGFMGFKSYKAKSILIKKWPKASFRKCNGNEIQNKNYILKSNPETICEKNLLNNQDKIKIRHLEKYKNVKWKSWQQEIIDISNKTPDDRTINWICDEKGNNGKTFLRKYLALKRKCLICDGKKDNVLNSLKTKMIDNNELIDIIIMDIPRHNQDYVNYGLLEQLKDGHVYSGKYEGAEIWLDPVHIFIFSNQSPDESKFSEDRWNIIKLT